MAKILNRSLRLSGERIQIGTPTVTVIEYDKDRMVRRASGASLPTDGDNGYAPGCFFYKTTGGSIGAMCYINEGTTTTADFNAVTSGSSGGVTTWDGLYDNDKTLSVDDGTLTFAGAAGLGAGDVLTVTATGGSGDCIQITQAGSGSDIKGTSNTWSVSKAGVGAFASLTGASLTSGTNLSLEATGAGTITIGGVSTGAIDIGTGGGTVTIASASLTITGSDAGISALILTEGDIELQDGRVSITDTEESTAFAVVSSNINTANVATITAASNTDKAILYLVAGALTTGYYLQCYDGAATEFSVGADGATVIATNVNSTVGLLVTGVQTNEDMVRFSSNGVTATGQSTLQVTAAGATAAGSAVLLVNHTGTPAHSTSYLAVFDYETATEATNDPITVEIRSGTSVGAALNIIAKGTTITGGILNFTVAELTTGVGINMTSLAALTTGNAIKIAHATSVIEDTGSLIAIASSGINTGGATNGTMLDIKSTGQVAGTEIRVDSINVTGTVMSMISTGIMTTTGNMLTITANAATTAAGLLRVNANGLTSGKGVIIASSSTALTTGYLFHVSHSGNATAGNPSVLSCFSSSAADDTAIVQILDAADLAGGVGLDISLAATTTGTGIDMGNFSAVTTGKGIFIDNDVSTLTSGYLIHLDSASTAMTTGRLLLVDHTGNATATALCSIAEIKSAAAENTVLLSLTASAALAGGVGLDISVAAMTTGTALDIGGMAAITTGKGINVAASGTTRTDGILVGISCASTAATSTGRMLLVDHTGATGVDTIITEIKTAAGDETVALQVLASGALALGKIVNVSGAAMTTGTALNIDGLDALTTGKAIYINSDSADVTARNLVTIHNDNAAAVGTVPLLITQDSPATAHFYKAIQLNSNSIWVGDGTTPNAALAATTGDILINGDSGKTYYCTNGAGSLWTALA